MPPEAIAAATLVTLVAGGLAIAELVWKPVRRYVLKRPNFPAATAEDIARLEAKLEEFQKSVAPAPPTAALPVQLG